VLAAYPNGASCHDDDIKMVALSPTVAASLPVVVESGAHLDALLFDDVRVRLGDVPCAPTDSPGVPLDPNRIFELEIGSGNWVPTATLSVFLQGVRIPAEPQICHHFGVESFALGADPHGSEVLTGLQLHDGTLLIAVRSLGSPTSIQLYQFGAGDQVTALPYSGGQIRSMFEDSTIGDIWVGTTDGCIGRLTRAATAADCEARSPTPDPLVDQLDGRHDNTVPFELFAVAGGQPAHFDGSGLTLLSTVSEKYTRVLRIAPGEAIFTRQDSGVVLHYKNGALLRPPELLDPAPLHPYGVTALASIAGVPTLAARLNVTDRAFFQFSQGAWSLLFHSPLMVADPHFIAPFQGGLVYGADSGWVGEYVPGNGPCAITSQVGQDLRFMSVSLDGNSLFAGTANVATLYRLTGTR
jgi:hypothetical protein